MLQTHNPLSPPHPCCIQGRILASVFQTPLSRTADVLYGAGYNGAMDFLTVVIRLMGVRTPMQQEGIRKD